MWELLVVKQSAVSLSWFQMSLREFAWIGIFQSIVCNFLFSFELIVRFYWSSYLLLKRDLNTRSIRLKINLLTWNVACVLLCPSDLFWDLIQIFRFKQGSLLYSKSQVAIDLRPFNHGMLTHLNHSHPYFFPHRWKHRGPSESRYSQCWANFELPNSHTSTLIC